MEFLESNSTVLIVLNRHKWANPAAVLTLLNSLDKCICPIAARHVGIPELQLLGPSNTKYARNQGMDMKHRPAECCLPNQVITGSFHNSYSKICFKSYDCSPSKQKPYL